MAGSGYHIFVAGPEGTGKTTIVRELVQRHARRRPAADDWCLVHNFADPYRPAVLRLAPGAGSALSEGLRRCIDELRRRLPRALAAKEYQRRRREIERAFEEKAHLLLAAVERQAARLGVGLNRSPEGLVPIVLKDGEPVDHQQFQALPKAQRETLRRRLRQVEHAIAEADRSAARAGQEMTAALERLRRETVGQLVAERLRPLRADHRRGPAAGRFLDQVAADLGDRLGREDDAETEEEDDGAAWEEEGFWRRYRVNLLADRRGDGGAPVVFESNPSYGNLFGRIERRSVQGTLSTDHTLVQGGALLRANGGYLILEVESVLGADRVWEALKRALHNRTLVIEDQGAG